MAKIVSKSQGTGNQKKATPKDVANRLATAPVEAPEKKVLAKPTPKPPVKQTVPPKAPAKQVAPAPKTPVKAPTSIEDKRKAQVAAQKKVAPPPVQEEEDEEGMFDDIIEGKNFRYVRIPGNKITQKDLAAHLATGEFPIHMWVNESRGDEEMAHYVLCYVSKTSATFINQTVEKNEDGTPGEDWDTLVSYKWAEFLGKEQILDITPRGKERFFDYALYVKEAK